jgi:hypothetical protein
MLRRAASVLTLLTLGGFATAAVKANTGRPSPDALTVHEWGTFTTVAGDDGKAIDWLPLGGPTDLPCFVEHFQNRALVKFAVDDPNQPVDYATARTKLLARVRMETPVVYFYAPREMTANVRVRFPRGLMTEWYPHALAMQNIGSGTMLKNPNYSSTLEWQNVVLSPAAKRDFPVGGGASHYYAARATEATPLHVTSQNEGFLFYRGVADFDVPLSAAPQGDAAVRITNLGTDELPGVVLFEKHGGALGYRSHGALRGEATLESPKLDGTLDGLRAELQQMLVSAGLFPKEAAAMVETWRDSWFEEGTRVFYVIPQRAMDSILPLQITPKPANIARVFVGRMDVITPRDQQAVESAIAHNDTRVLEQYARFLSPITDRILAKTASPAAKARIREITTATFASYLKRATVCE